MHLQHAPTPGRAAAESYLSIPRPSPPAHLGAFGTSELADHCSGVLAVMRNAWNGSVPSSPARMALTMRWRSISLTPSNDSETTHVKNCGGRWGERMEAGWCDGLSGWGEGVLGCGGWRDYPTCIF